MTTTLSPARPAHRVRPLAPRADPSHSRAVAPARTAALPAEPLAATAAPRERSPHAVHEAVPAHIPGREAGRPGDPTALACSIAQAIVETLRGVRPLAQLTRWLAPEIHTVVARRRDITLAAGPHPTRPARVRRARVHRVDARTAEATVVVEDLDRVRAAAMRLEHVRGAWRVTALVLG